MGARDYAAKIGKLIAMAEDESLTEEVRASYRAKAEQLMREYRISEEEAIAQDSEAATKPIRFEVTLLEAKEGYVNGLLQHYVNLWYYIGQHAGLKSHFEYRYNDQAGTYCVLAVGYGYDIDVRLAEFLWTAAHLVFITRIDPKVDPSLSDRLNCYYLRGSGLPRNEVARMLWGSAMHDSAAHGKVQQYYLLECKSRGEQPAVAGRGIQVGRYREAYAQAFVEQFSWRLADARSAIDAESGTLVLSGRAERVAEAYYTEWPDRRPMSQEERVKRAAQQEAEWARELAECKRCTDEHRCRKHRPRYATATEQKRWERERNAPERAAGYRAGGAAANSVDFRRTAGDRRQKTEAGTERQSLPG